MSKDNKADNDLSTVTQEQVTQFYNNLIFPSRSSHKAYEELVPDDLSGKRIGDFGCGQSLFIDILKKMKYDAVFLDISPNVLANIDYGEKILASLTDIPLPDENMDVIFCIGVVHHIPEMGKAVAELCRVLIKGGRLYLGVYDDKTLQAFLRRMYDYSRSKAIRKLIYNFSGLLIWIKNKKNGLSYGSLDHIKRIDDLLKTPLVRYLPSSKYISQLELNGCEVRSVKKISSMNIISAIKRRTIA